MLVYFFSDRNYVRSGFYAHFTLSRCPHNCSGHGDCVVAAGQCRCTAGYVGRACERAVCPHAACLRHGGHCDGDVGRCVCPAGRRGHDCGLALDPMDASPAGVWTQVTADDNDLARRAGITHLSVCVCVRVLTTVLKALTVIL